MPMGKEEGASVFLRIVIKKPTSHAVSLALFMSACSDSEIPLVMRLLMIKQISFINFVSPSCTVSLVHLAKLWCTAAKIGGEYLQKNTLWNNFIQKGRGTYFWGWITVLETYIFIDLITNIQAWSWQELQDHKSLIMTRATRSLGIKKASSHGPGSIPAGYMTVFVMHTLCAWFQGLETI